MDAMSTENKLFGENTGFAINVKFRPVNIPDDFLEFGYYFKSDNDTTTTYLITGVSAELGTTAKTKIYSTDVLDNHFDTAGIKCGDLIGVPKTALDWVVNLELCGKYFFPEFNNEMQLYYDDEKFYSGKCKTNSITSMMECVNFAIEVVLRDAGIKPY